MPPLRKDSVSSINFDFSAVFRGTILALVVSMLGAAFLGLFFYFLNTSETLMPSISVAILFISVFIGGMFSAYSAGNKGIYHGLAVGGLFFVFSWLLVVLLFPGSLAFGVMIQKLILTVIAGGLGGILGVGLST